ncbi:hypothetical protein CONPUDRAFT_147060 [Coniophora puteana RWD-64-598 SS2]|uniref:E2 ubiquitin-conjugating enzyme n=1 Tax=Coniophora puteana (strain RWD-64-598) TaxID=741705 RepID=A0A5M3MB01_CONPW|nr:uncharacterized protein CONPUDRAFT_147060 [Coniophora puteana RWD-64-598 SS2]EIW76054.1 hypothetical protein CONPUDRAFT_147060 [Coniophora puteana RWD-64-598 SS2]
MAPTPSPMTMKRIHREISDSKKEDLGTMTLAPSDESLFRWSASIPGPQGSPYEGGVFKLEIVLGHDYPFSAPKVIFLTRIYHMNISDRGSICIDILKGNWSPALSLFKVMLSLSSLLTDPNPSDPLVPSIATEYVRNRQQHDRTAKEWTDLYAKPGARSQFSSSSSAMNGSSNQSARTRGSRAAMAAASGPLPPLTIDNIAARTQRSSAAILASRARDYIAAHAAGSRPSLSASVGAIRTRPVEVPGSRTATPAAGPSRSGVGSAIVIEDSDDESGRPASSTRAEAKRKRNPQHQGRDADVEILEDRNVRQRVEPGGGGTGTSISGRSEVIVIDD